MQASQRSFEIVLLPFTLPGVVPQSNYASRPFRRAPLCCLTSLSSHCSVFKVQSSSLISKTRFQHSTYLLNAEIQPPTSGVNPSSNGGDSRDRTGDLLLARQALSQLSYIPTSPFEIVGGPEWARTTDLTIISRTL